MRDALLALALFTAGCSHGANRAPPQPQAQTTVRVRNQSSLDMDVFVLNSSQRTRLGIVRAVSTQVFPIAAEFVRISPQLRFELHAIGGGRNPRTEAITVFPGDHVELVIPPL